MKKMYFALISIFLVLLNIISFAQKAPLWDTPQCRNSSGGSPEQPATIYLGDQGTFGCDSWEALNGQWPDWKVVIHTTSDVGSGTYGTASSISYILHKTGTSPRFTSTGTWYWGIQVHYGDAGYNYWYCRNDLNYYNMWGTPTSDLTVTVSALENPTSLTATQTSISQINLSWTKWNSKNVMVVRRLTSAAASTDPTQGTTYTVGVAAPQLGTGTVVYNGSGTSFNDTGLTPGTSYTYTFYSENYSYYSAGATAEATTATQTSAATDYFRSKATGNWSVAGTWESSPDNTNWITSTLVPDASAAATAIQTGHTVTLNATANAKYLTIGGTLSFGANTLNIATGGTLTNNGIFTYGTGTVAFAGSGTVTGTIGFYNVTLAGSVNFGTSATINGTLQINSGGYVNTNAPTYATGSTLKYSSGGTYGRGLEWSTTSGAGYPYSVQISGNTTLDMGANSGTGIARQCSGNLTVDLGSTFTMNNAGNVMTAAVTVLGSISNTGTITLSGSIGGDLKTQGNIVDNGTFNANGRAIFFNGGNIQDISGVGTIDISYVRINKTGGYVRLGSSLVCDGTNTGNAMEIEGTTSILDLNGKLLTLGKAGVNSTYNIGIATPGFIRCTSSSDISILGTGTLGTIYFDQSNPGTTNNLRNLTINRTSSGSVILGNELLINTTLTLTSGVITGPLSYTSTGTLKYNGTQYTTTGDVEFPATNGPKNLNITNANASGISLHANRKLLGTMIIASGKKFIIPASKQLEVVGDFTNSAGTTGLVIKSTGSLIQNTVNVPATVERDITGWGEIPNHGWHLLSSPVTVQAIDPNFTTSTPEEYDFYAWWEPTNEWINYKNTSVDPTWETANILQLPDGDISGYDFFIPGKGYLIAYLTTSTKQFIGNLNKTDVRVDNLPINSGVNQSWHLLGNPFTSALKWNDGNWGEMTNIATTAKIWNEFNASYTDIATNGIIPAMNGFMVRVTKTGDNSITIPAAARVHDATSWYKSSEVPAIKLLAIDLTGQTAQESKINIVPEASVAFDAENDSYFLPGYAPQFYSQIPDVNLSTNALPTINENTIIPFGFVKNSSSDFTIQLKESIEGYTIYLKDLKSNTDHNLSADSVYAFTSFEGDDPNRFLLHFKQTTGVSDEVDDQKLEFVYNNGALYLSGLETDAEIRVTNMLGQLVLSRFATGNDVQELNTSGLSKGVYILSVLTGSQKKSGKFVVR